ncbi:MAG: T9SS type A sorting domain-containing protein [Bacteroidota bacterium]
MQHKYIFLFVCSWFVGLQQIGAQCAEQTHTPFAQDSWLSCQMADSPNPERGFSHWILYDLGWEYTLDSTFIWNLNTWGQSGLGVKELAIDYSIDATNWTTLGTFEVARASASVKYEGTIGPSFEQTPARYVLLTALSNWEGSAACVGFSEIRFNVSQTTSVDPDLNLALSMSVQPNPVRNLAQISMQAPQVPDRLALFDLSGKEIQVYQGLMSKNVELDMSQLAGGIYWVKAWFDQTVLTEKIVKVN